jgi:hypothetical protein
MNEFSDIESELKKLRPAQPSANLLSRVANAIAGRGEAERSRVDLSAEEKIVRPHQFRIHWLSLGASLAAAAVVLIFLRFDFNKETRPRNFAMQSPTATKPVPATFIPAGATQVVYNTRDEGLYFPSNSAEPVRRVRSRTQETLQWRNPATGASLQVSYPAEHLEFIPVSGQ